MPLNTGNISGRTITLTTEDLYQLAGALHGSICGGIILGVRMALLGCKMVKLSNPQHPENRKKLTVLVETDRCATDAIQTVTGCTLGRRTLRVIDYGIMAGTFINLETAKAVRISIHPDSRERAKEMLPSVTENKRLYAQAYRSMSDQDLFVAEEVKVDINSVGLPGHANKRTACDECREELVGGYQIVEGQRSLCRRCARLPLYYNPLNKLSV